MSTLIAVAFKDKYGAQDALNKLIKLEKDYLIDLDDAVVATRREDGKVKLKQSVNLVGAGAISGAFWGGLLGLIFGGGLGFLIVGGAGAAIGALGGTLGDFGINDQFMKRLGTELQPGSSALFVLVRRATEDRVLEELEGLGGTVLKTSLSKEGERRLQKVLEGETTLVQQEKTGEKKVTETQT